MSRRAPVGRLGSLAMLGAMLLAPGPVATAQAPAASTDAAPLASAPPLFDDFETDSDSDGLPDGWYNGRDAAIAPGGQAGKSCLRLRNDAPGRPARLSRAFAADGRTTEALIVALWVKLDDILPGERIGEEPGLLIDYLGADVRSVRRQLLGPWSRRSVGDGWVRIAKRLPIPPTSRDAILTVGLMGATGSLDIDGLAIDAVPRGGASITNLVLNGDLELGDPEPASWILQRGARRVAPGRATSTSALELPRGRSLAIAPIGVPVGRFDELYVAVSARASGLGSAVADVYFLDDEGRALPDATVRAFTWSGSFDWRFFRTRVKVPGGARRGLVQFEKLEPGGTLRLDDVQVLSSPAPNFGAWTPYRETDEVDGWIAYEPAAAIEPGSALDASALLNAPAGKSGRVVVRQGRLHFERGGRARFFGASILPSLLSPPTERADALADRLARSGINLARLGPIDVTLGPGFGLIDDARDDTGQLDPESLARFHHLVAALKRRGIAIALDLQGERRFREADGLADARALPPSGGPAAAFDPAIRAKAVELARTLLDRVNPETGLRLRDDPALAWASLAAERSAFDLLDEPPGTTDPTARALRERLKAARVVDTRRGWQAAESAQWVAEARALRDAGLAVPIAGGSHWRREPELAAALTAPGLDLVDDRLYWSTRLFAAPDHRSLVWDPGALATLADRKRRTDRPYVAGEWAAQTRDAWAWPYEAADLLAAARTAAVEDWDALVRRGVHSHPETWGAAAPGTGGDSDAVVVPEVLNANPAAFAVLPHAASLFFRGREALARPRTSAVAPGWLAIDTPHTVALAGWVGGRDLRAEAVTIDVSSRFGVVAVSALGPEPIAQARRLLVTAVARAQPTGFAWTDATRREVAEPGQPPLLLEPVRARVAWTRKGTIKAYRLDSSGHRAAPATAETIPNGVRLPLDTAIGSIHWELVVE